DVVIAIVVSSRVVTLCRSLNALADLTVAFTTLSWVPYLGSGVSGLVVAALAALSLVAKGVVLAVRTAVVLSSVFVWPCLDELLAIVSGVVKILGTADARVPLAAAGAVSALFLLGVLYSLRTCCEPDRRKTF
ncbi:hypothetical protein GQX74_005653, partial [Glossina fuscipes]